MTRFLLALIAFYRRRISPALHVVSRGRCKFFPTCSEYAAIAIATHGPLRGCGLAAWRLVRCHPFTPGGFDPVPPPSGPVPQAASRPVSQTSCGGDSGCAARSPRTVTIEEAAASEAAFFER
ncbi:MAG: membrane protein insertion efficiency factor YidD [Terracidiphilus sp.]